MVVAAPLVYAVDAGKEVYNDRSKLKKVALSTAIGAGFGAGAYLLIAGNELYYETVRHGVTVPDDQTKADFCEEFADQCEKFNLTPILEYGVTSLASGVSALAANRLGFSDAVLRAGSSVVSFFGCSTPVAEPGPAEVTLLSASDRSDLESGGGDSRNSNSSMGG